MSFFADLAVNPFLVTGLAAGALAGLSCGVVGPYVVSRRIVFLAGAIAHIAVGGLGAALFLTARYPDALGWLRPVHGATAIAVAAALLLAVVHVRARERVDTLIGALWAAGMAAGILLVKMTPGYHSDLMSYLFGNLSFVSRADLAWIAILDAVVLVVAFFFHKRFLAICLDPEQAELQGVSLLATEAVLLVLVALTVISLTQVVGLILVIALLSLPAAVAGHHQTRLVPIVVTATVLAVVLATVPRIAVYGTGLSPEPVIVLAAGATYLLSLTLRRLRAG